MAINPLAADKPRKLLALKSVINSRRILTSIAFFLMVISLINFAQAETLWTGSIDPMNSGGNGPSAPGTLTSNVTAGINYLFSASGSIAINTGGTSFTPDGSGDVAVPGSNPSYIWVKDGMIRYSLIGKIGNNFIQMGSSGSFTATENTTLVLYINDDNVGDNTGTWYVNITYQSGCIDNDHDGYGKIGTDLTLCSASSTIPDCNDNDSTEHPGVNWYYDADGDNYYALNNTCQRGSGNISLWYADSHNLGLDCDDDTSIDPPGNPDGSGRYAVERYPTSPLLPAITDMVVSGWGFPASYINSTLIQRRFYPAQLTPYDNFYVNFTANKCGNSSYPASLNMGISINATTATSTRQIITGTAQKVSETDTSAIYQWQISAWPGGITGNIPIMEVLIDSIANNRPVKAVVSKFGITKSLVLPLSNCVHVMGNDSAPYKIVYMRGLTPFGLQMSPQQLMSKETQSESFNFNLVPPFKNYQLYFKHFVDLTIHNSLDLNIVNGSFDTAAFNTVPSISSCGSDGRLYYYHNFRSPNVNSPEAGYTHIGERTIFLNPTTSPFEIYIHEAGHAFCNLNDEYTYSVRGVVGPSRNCVMNPLQAFNISGTSYGSNIFVGCTYYQNPILPQHPFYYRPSKKSVMNTGPFFDPRFSVLDCGYCAMEITKDYAHLKNYMDWCKNSVSTSN